MTGTPTSPRRRRGRRAHTPTTPTDRQGPHRVAIYIRRSTDDEHQPFSLDAQRAALTKYVKAQPGWIIVAEYEDDASGATTDRPGLKKAINAAKAGPLRHPSRLPHRPIQPQRRQPPRTRHHSRTSRRRLLLRCWTTARVRTYEAGCAIHGEDGWWRCGSSVGVVGWASW